MFLDKNYKFLLCQFKFLVSTASKLLATLVLFEADSGLSFLTYSYVEFLMVTSWKHSNFPYDSVAEICIQMRESFTSAEKSDLCILVENAADAAHLKLDKYFNATDGVYPSLEFLKEVEYFYPLKAIGFPDGYGFCKIVGINC